MVWPATSEIATASPAVTRTRIPARASQAGLRRQSTGAPRPTCERRARASDRMAAARKTRTHTWAASRNRLRHGSAIMPPITAATASAGTTSASMVPTRFGSTGSLA